MKNPKQPPVRPAAHVNAPRMGPQPVVRPPARGYQPNNAQRPRSKTPVLLGLCVLALCGGGGVLYFLHDKNKKAEAADEAKAKADSTEAMFANVGPNAGKPSGGSGVGASLGSLGSQVAALPTRAPAEVPNLPEAKPSQEPEPKPKAVMADATPTVFPGGPGEGKPEVSTGPLEPPVRSWVSHKGTAASGSLVTVTATNLTLKLTDGRQVDMPRSSLSKEDQSYLDAWIAETGLVVAATPNDKPPTPAGTATPPPTVTTKPPLGARLAAAGSIAPVNFDGAWPEKVEVPEELNIEVIKEDDAEQEYIYRSTHFEFTSDVKLKARLVSTCAKIFEASHEYLRLLPLNNTATDGKLGHFPVYFFEEFSSYVKAGGPPGSAGVCMSSSAEPKSKVLVPLDSMGVKKVGKEYSVDSRDKDFKVIAHELTHQLMARDVKQASWYIEGSAEYVAYTEYTGGKFKVETNKRAIVASITAYGKDGSGGRALTKEFTMPALKDFMELSYSNFIANSNFNYGVGCLLTYYWYHQDGEEDAARIKKYLKALQDGEEEKVACEKCLLDGRTWPEMQEIFQKSMKKLGVKVNFDK